MSVYLDRGVIPYSEGGGLVHKPSDSLDAYQLVEPGNFVLNNQQAWRGSVGVSKHRGLVSPAYLIFELSKNLDADFANYQFRDTRFVDQMMLSSQGVGDIQRQVKWPLLRLAKVLLPPIEEQRAIAAYLDRATARIDALVAKKTRFIELLREKRQALITQAVTKGLDPNVPKQDTGAPWLGWVPAHWHVKPLWSMYRAKKETGHPKETLLSVYRDYGVIEKSSRDDNKNRESDDLGGYQLVVCGDLVTNKMKTWQGSIAVSSIQGIVSPAYYVYRKLHAGNDGYFHHLFRSLPYITGYNSISKGIRVGQWDLEADKFRLFPVLIPPKPEQDAIVAFVDRETTRIDKLIDKTERSIELLHEHRTALITAAVTGKIDLRDAA